MAKRGGVKANANAVVLHIAMANGRTVCGREASKVNCAGSAVHARALLDRRSDALCKRCAIVRGAF